jgi:hypothetical protein
MMVMGWGVLGGLLVIGLLLVAMWFAFNIKDYGVNNWVEEEGERTERKERRAEEDDREERRRAAIYCLPDPGRRLSLGSPAAHTGAVKSISLDSAISVSCSQEVSSGASGSGHRPQSCSVH